MQSTEPLKPYKGTSRPPVAHTLLVIMIVVMKVLCNPHVLYTRNVSSLIKGLLISVNDGIFSTDRFISRN